MHFLTFNSLRNTFKSGLVAFVFLFVSSFAFGGSSCIYVDAAGIVQCTYFSSGSIHTDTECANLANAAGALPLDCSLLNPGCNGNYVSGGNWCNNFGAQQSCHNERCAQLVVILPIALLGFGGVEMNEDNILNWSTESEINNSHYIISHSFDGVLWNSLSEIPGAGNSSETLSYRFIHNLPDPTINYYKLIQVDYDGKSASYGPISIDNRRNKRNLIRITNMLGQAVSENYTGIVILHYDDGSYEKIYK
jgi:hypothetical protein